MYLNPYLLAMPAVGKSEFIWNSIRFSNQTKSENKKQKLIMYRGNKERNAIFDVSSSDLKLTKKWQTDKINFGIHGASKASVVADSENLYVGSDTSWFYSFKKSTGQINWKFYLGDSTRGIHSSAVIDDDAVYVGSYRGSVYKINKSTGQLIWMRIIGHTVGASPFIDDEYILFNIETTQPDGYLVKLKKIDGSIVWQTENLGEQSHSSPTFSVDKKTFTVGVNNSTLQAFDYMTGQKKWLNKISGPSKSTSWTDRESSYLSSWGKELIKFEIETGKIIWSAAMNLKSQVSPAFSEKYQIVIIADAGGTVYGFDSKSGKLNWKFDNKISFQMSSPVLIRSKDKENFLFYCRTNQMCLINPSNGEITKSWLAEGHFTGSPLIDENVLYLSMNDGGVLAYDIN